MSVTSAERRELVASLASFKENVKEVKERFYNFLVKYNPKGYASFNLEAYPGGFPVSVDAFEVQLSEKEDLYFEKTFEDSSEFPVFMFIPDTYLDDPDAWEENILSELAVDTKIAASAIKMFFEEDAGRILYRTERATAGFNRKFVNIIIDNYSIPSSKWALFKNLTPLNRAILSVNRSTGAVFEGSARRERIESEAEDSGFRGYCI